MAAPAVMPLSGSYHDDLDIISLSAAIVSYLTAEAKQQWEIVNAKMQRLLAESKQATQEDQKRELLVSYGQAFAELQELEVCNSVRKFQQEVKGYLDEYGTLAAYKSVVTFGRKAIRSGNLSPEETAARVELIGDFLHVAERHAPVNYQCLRKETICCCCCGAELLRGVDICQECGQILNAEVAVRIDSEAPSNQPETVKKGAERALSKLKTTPNPKLPTSQLAEQLGKIDWSSLTEGLPGDYILFKLAQLNNRSLSRADAGLIRYTRERLVRLDNTWRGLAERNKLEYLTS